MAEEQEQPPASPPSQPTEGAPTEPAVPPITIDPALVDWGTKSRDPADLEERG